ncbi:MAG: site-specific DNA-methyltransferase [Candidatus Fimivivens sp.]
MNNNLYRFLNNPAFDALQKTHEQFDNSALFSTMNELQRTLDMVKVPTSGITAALQTYQDSIAPLMSTVQNINNLYAPILEQTKKYEGVYNSSMVAVLQSSAAAMKAMAGLDFSAIENIANSLPKYDFLSESILRNIDFDDIGELYENGEITDDDIAGEFSDIVTQKDFSFVESWDKVKKAKWFLALRCLFIILTFLGKPAIDKVADNTLEALGVKEFWAESGIYEWLDDFFGVESCNGTVTEQEAKETVKEEIIGNVSKQKRDDLISKIKEIRTYISAAQQDENTGNLLTYLSELEKDVNGKKYGLIFEEHREEIDEVLSTHTPVLEEDESLFIDNGGNMNFLIEGDNLASLKLLEKTHRNKVDIIFIDPPYNRGQNDFIYDDNFIIKTDTFIHSKYLSFMEKRLQLAKKLLSSNGCIFINIDDNEFSQLKMLCDTIFGNENYVACLPWHNRTSIQNDTDISINHEYILVYAKRRRQTNRRLKTSNAATWYSLNDFVFQPKITDKSKYSNPDNDVRGLWKADPFDAPAIRENLTYEIINPNTGAIYLPPKGRHWRTEESKYKALLADNRIVFGKTGKSKPQLKVFYDEVQQKGEIANSWLDSNVFDTSTNGKKELLSILYDIPADKMFDTPKPTKLYVELLRLIVSPMVHRPIVLDFFAGSGTTGQSVMEYNKQENKNLVYILCTNNQNDICKSITYERIKRVINKENYTASLKYFKVEYVPISKRMYYEYADELLKHIRELVELENGVNFNDNAEITIVLTEEELDSFVSSLGKDSRCCKLYMGHDLLPSGEQENILAAQGIKINIIPDYYYRDLQEG